MTRIFRCHEKVYLFSNLNCTISFESYMILMRVGNQKTIIYNKFRAIEQIYMLDPVKQNILGRI